MRLKDKVAVITGAASGIGEATSRRFVAEGATVVMVDYDAQTLERAAAAIGTAGHVADVSSGREVAELFKRVQREHGRVDVLFNNAGVARNGTVVSTPEEEWDRTFAINVKSVYLCSQAAIPLMSRGGSIVNTASSWAYQAANNVAAYSASKAAVLNLTRSIAIDFAESGIRCNALVPGTTQTAMVRSLLDAQENPTAATRFYEQMQPIQRMASPDELTGAVVYLASDDASYTTGAVFCVDGGYSAGRTAFE
jgi:NAD(P)-dependent dehydrogenase (short-subunit alcohol dehydrogenase family)